MKRRSYLYPALVFVLSCSFGLWIGGSLTRADAAVQLGAERWRPILGYADEGQPAFAVNAAGRSAQASFNFRSFRDQNIYFLFTPVSGQRTIERAALLVVERNGSYAGAATVQLEVRGLDGTLSHVASDPITLQNVAVGAWLTFTLSTTAADLVIEPNETLVLNFALDGAPAGDLATLVGFEIDVASDVAPPPTATPTITPSATTTPTTTTTPSATTTTTPTATPTVGPGTSIRLYMPFLSVQ